MKKRSVIAVMVSLAAIVTLALGVSGATANGGGGDLTLMVDVDEASFDAPLVPGPFNVEGTIVVEGGGSGTFQCWGWVFADFSTNVSQVYSIDGRGAIMTQGHEGVPRAVVGGTGDFDDVEGEALQVFTGPEGSFDFTIEFDD